MLTLDTIPIPAAGVVGRILDTGPGDRPDHEAVLVLPAQGQVKVLNEVGARIWELADGTRSLRAIAGLLCQEYQVEAAQAEADVLRFVSDLAGRGILSVGGQTGKE
jgi:hypothetical protein